MQKIILILSIFFTLAHATPLPPKSGCILAQKGDVSINWSIYNDNTKIAIQGSNKSINYTPIAKEGVNFAGILVGSTMQISIKDESFKNQSLLAKITKIQSQKRVDRDPRTGMMVVNITLNRISKNIPMSYFYNKGDLKLDGFIDLKEFNLQDSSTYVQIKFELYIDAVVCAVKH